MIEVYYKLGVCQRVCRFVCEIGRLKVGGEHEVKVVFAESGRKIDRAVEY